MAATERGLLDYEAQKQTLQGQARDCLQEFFGTDITRTVEWGYFTADDPFFSDRTYSTAEFPLGHPADEEALGAVDNSWSQTAYSVEGYPSEQGGWVRDFLGFRGACALWRFMDPEQPVSSQALFIIVDLGPVLPWSSRAPDDHLMISFISHTSLDDLVELGLKVDEFNAYFRDNPLPHAYGVGHR